MDILGVGPLELLVILVFILIFVGPERLPQVARQIGKVYRQLQEMSRTVAAQWQEELSAAAELEGEKKGLREILSEPLQAAKADAERVLTTSLSTPPYEQPGDTKPLVASSSVVSSPATATAPDGRTSDNLTASVIVSEVAQDQETHPSQEMEEGIVSPSGLTAPNAEVAGEDTTSAPPEDVPDATPQLIPPSDSDSEHGNQ